MNTEHVIKVNVKNHPIQTGVPVAFGCPFPKGLLTSLKQLQLCQNTNNQQSRIIPITIKALNYWPDSSYKWLEIAFVLSSAEDELSLKVSNSSVSTLSTPESQGIEFSQQHNGIDILCNQQNFVLSSNTPGLPWLKTTATEEHDAAQGLVILDENNRVYTAKGQLKSVEQFKDPHSVQCLGLQVVTEGSFENTVHSAKVSQLRFTLRSTFNDGSPFVKCELEIHNTAAALHQSGQWDLGDPASVKIAGIKLPFAINNTAGISLNIADTVQQNFTNEHWSLTQYSSGGDNWQSPNHVDETNQVPLLFKGAQLTINQKLSAEIFRPCPSVTVAQINPHQSIQLAMENFWQAFPNKISGMGKTIEFDFLPGHSGAIQELQAGEKLTKTLWIALGSQDDTQLNWVFNKPIIYLEQDWYDKCGVVNSLAINLGTANLASSHEIGRLMQSGLLADNNFFSKREQIDEYGWRNFGDLFADHETAGYSGNELFISHYNNQYDPLYGFIRRYLETGNPAWFTLANDLAQHVKNIDIYHTSNDKAEYNGGLFWHTDHYIKAYTSSHRSYSKLQESDVYQDHAGGGGPGGQHCYTTGLTYHYLLTGEPSSKEAVLTLTQWICHVYDGTGTLFELLLGIKNRHVAGLKNHLSGRYPFDRGTANLINALLDSYELTQEEQYLTRAEHVIQNTVHPADNIAERHLDNVELSWFYTVFLQALTRYLDVKRENNTLDADFYYARDALLHYANWMLDNEAPYLDKPDILEFPNDTWTAQDLRKTAVLAAAWYYSDEKNPALLEKAKYYQHYVATKLAASEEQTYTRVLALLMQNSGSLEYYLQAKKLTQLNPPKQNWPLAAYMTSGFVSGIVKQFCKRLATFSMANEYRWLTKRLGK